MLADVPNSSCLVHLSVLALKVLESRDTCSIRQRYETYFWSYYIKGISKNQARHDSWMHSQEFVI